MGKGLASASRLESAGLMQASCGVTRPCLILVCVAALQGCAAATVNYTDPAGPRYAAAGPRRSDEPDTLKVVAFNVKYGRHVTEVLALLRHEGPLHDPDVLLLQEMDEAGTRAIRL